MDFELMTDEELALLAKEDKGKPFEVLFGRYKTSIDAIIRSKVAIGVSGVEYDDLMQESALALDSAVDNYDGVSAFKAYACACVNNRVLSALRSSSRKKNEPLKNYIPLSGYGEGDADKFEIFVDKKVGPEDLFIDNEKKVELENLIKKHLSDLEYKIFSLHRQGYSYLEIAEKLNETVKVVDNAMQRVRKKLGSKFSEV